MCWNRTSVQCSAPTLRSYPSTAAGAHQYRLGHRLYLPARNILKILTKSSHDAYLPALRQAQPEPRRSSIPRVHSQGLHAVAEALYDAVVAGTFAQATWWYRPHRRLRKYCSSLEESGRTSSLVCVSLCSGVEATLSSGGERCVHFTRK